MSYKKATYLALALIVLLGGVYFWAAIGIRDPRTRGSIGPGYFPVILSGLLVILCATSFVKTLLQEGDRTVTVPNPGRVAMAVAMIALFLLAWRHVDAFYLIAFAFAALLMTLFSPGWGWRQHLVNLSLALVLTVGIYGLFGYIMQVRF